MIQNAIQSARNAQNADMTTTVLQQSPQIITIQQQSAQISVSLPDLVPYYQNVSQDQTRISYQIFYFDFPGDQYTLITGDQVYIAATITSVDPSNANILATELSAYSSLGFGTTLTSTAVSNAAEFANYIQLILKQQATYYGIQTVTDSVTICWQMFYQNLVSFNYDASSSKYTLVMNGTNAAFPVTYKTGTLVLYSVDFVLRVSPTLPSDNQITLARLVGAPFTAPVTSFVTGVGNVPLYESHFVLPFAVQRSVGPGVFYGPYHIMYVRKTQPATAGKYMTGSADNIVLYSGEVPKLHLDDFIYVHTSAYTGMWDGKTGRKTDLLAVLPRTRGFGATALYSEVHTMTSEFFNNDTLSSLKTLFINLTDKAGNICEDFHNPFTLQIAIKFI